MKRCTACHSPIILGKVMEHPLLSVPICETCNWQYNSGEFEIEEDNEIYCRFCGEGEGNLILCDSCPKSFCVRCIGNCFGQAELRRILSLSDRWNCLICSPQPLIDLCIQNGWKYRALPDEKAAAEGTKRACRGMICADISKGREKFEIPVFNEVDKERAPLSFVYIAAPVAGKGVKLTNNPQFLACCSCTDNCQDPTKCECALRMNGFAYDQNGILVPKNPSSIHNGIFECNSRCNCHKDRCKNRVVGNGSKLRLEVFRCENPAKGWGRTLQD